MQPDLRWISVYIALPQLPTSTVALVTMLLGLIGDKSKFTIDLTRLKEDTKSIYHEKRFEKSTDAKYFFVEQAGKNENSI